MRYAPEHIDTETHLAMRSIIERIATGPELSQDTSPAAVDHARRVLDAGRALQRVR